MGYGWFVREIATLFFVMGIFSGIAMNTGANRITKLFIEGMKDILSAAVVVGLAGGILVILEDGRVIDSLIYHVASSMQEFGKLASVSMMYLIQTGINIVIPSGSAKAALTMPIMSQFSDLIGVSRQATVMAFQLGDGFTNVMKFILLLPCIALPLMNSSKVYLVRIQLHYTNLLITAEDICVV